MSTNPSHEPAPLLLRQAAQVYHTSWLPLWHREGSRGDSPPEDTYFFVLSTVLAGEIRSGRITLRRHHIVQNPALSKLFYEADCLVRVGASDASAIFEISSYRHHASTEERWEVDVRRGRELRSLGHRLETYTTREASTDPWGTALDSVRLLNSWSEFPEIVLPESLVDLARSFSAAAEARAWQERVGLRESAAPKVPHSEPKLEWCEIERRIAELPHQYETHDADEIRLRARYPRAYEPWTDLEVTWLRRAESERLSNRDMLRIFRRSPGAVRKCLRREERKVAGVV